MEEDNTDSSSNGGLSGLLGNLVTAGTQIATSQLNKTNTPAPAPRPAAAAPTAAPASSSSWTKYLPYGIGAIVLLVVVGLFLKRR